MKDIRTKTSNTIIKRLGWQTGIKDQAGIAGDLAAGKDIEEVYGLGKAGLFDEFFFLDELGILKLFSNLDPKRTELPTNIQFPAVILIYVMRIVAGLTFFWHTEPVLLLSQSLMRLIGFNAKQILDGTCRRGLKKSQLPADVDETQNESSQIRGPICADSVATYISAIAATALEKLFNKVVGILAANSFFPKCIHAIMDSSEVQSTEKCQGCGKVSKEKAPSLRLRKGRIRKVLETVFGFKIWLVWDPNSKLPIAMRFTTIEVNDTQMAREVVQQAIINLGDHITIASIAFDRGFIDGSFMWWLDGRGIKFYVPAKTNMTVYQDALSLAADGIRQTREKTRSVGHGKNKQTVTDRWDVVGIEALTSAGFYGEQGSGSHENRNDFIPNPINAVVVLHDPYKENNPKSDTRVILTNASVARPLAPYDAYDQRSEIENAMFREAKQAWFLQRPAKNTADAFRAHAYLTIIVMALTTAFQTWVANQDKLHQQGKETGIRKFREQVRIENCNKLIVFDEERYAIFEAYELLILLGKKVLKPRGKPETITKEDILKKYGALRE